MASQVQQVFYIEDPTEKMIFNVIKKLPRNWCDAESENANEGQDVLVLHVENEKEVNDGSWCRDDIPARQGPIDLA